MLRRVFTGSKWVDGTGRPATAVLVCFSPEICYPPFDSQVFFMIEFRNDNIYGAFRTLAPRLWQPFLAQPLLLRDATRGSNDVTRSPL